MIFDPIKAMQKDSEQRQAQIEEENRILRNCEKQYIVKYVFPDTTETFNKDEAMLYSDKYFERIYDIQKRFIDYIYDDKNKIEDNNQYIKYDKDIVNNFKKEYYKLLWELFFERFGSSKYDEYFKKFADNPENDMLGAARCVNNIPFEWISFIELGRELISCDHIGRKFNSFRAKCNYIEEEYYSQLEK